ncbi:MAG TPA: ABC transporter substrate-binding protein [Solirubrobacteraceae bacterium]|nr:ABC transporter substrate-binding protein [Solirubrobacteraceae bacterium]
MSASPMAHLTPRRALAGLLSVAVLVAAIVASIGASTAGAATKCKSYQTLRTGKNIAAAYNPPQITAATGFLKQECVKLQEQDVAGAAVLLAQVEAGRADMALLNPAGIVQAVESGIKLKIIAPNTGPGDFAICVSKNSSITSDPKTWKQFEGKSVVTTLLGSNTDIAFRVKLARAGVDLDKVKFVQILQASLAQSIINQTVAGGQCNEPNIVLNADKFRVIDQNPMAEVYGKDSPVTYAITTESFYNSHKPLITAYQKAYLRTAKLVARNPTTYRRLAHYFMQLPTDVTNKMRLAAMPTTYAYDQLVKQLKSLQQFGAIKALVPDKQLKALFVPLPTSS